MLRGVTNSLASHPSVACPSFPCNGEEDKDAEDAWSKLLRRIHACHMRRRRRMHARTDVDTKHTSCICHKRRRMHARTDVDTKHTSCICHKRRRMHARRDVDTRDELVRDTQV